MASNMSSSLSRPWVLVTTGFVAAYGTYLVWSTWPSRNNASTNLQRRSAVRNRNNPRTTTRIWASAPSSDPLLPFGLLHVDHEGIVVRFPNGPEPPTVAEIQEALNLTNSRAFNIAIEVQGAALKQIFLVLMQSVDQMSAEQLAATMELRELVSPLHSRDINALLAKIHMLCSGSWTFDQAAVARAFADHCGLDRVPMIPDGTDLGYTETSADSDLDNEKEPAQGIKGLLYSIAEETARLQAYVHAGIRCEQCNQCPIRGIRWHCMNCPDFDLCSICEAHPLHPKTHVFVKIKIPISALAQPHQILDAWYPSESARQWPVLRGSLRKRLAAETGLEDLKIEALYDQFTCIANVSYPGDPLRIDAAIDRRAFNKAMMSPTWKRPVEPNFLYDRMFNFYDTDNNGLIGFEEYVSGISYLLQPAKRSSLERILRGYDVDGDGFVGRRDFMRMMSAKYAVQKNIIQDVIDAAEMDMVRDTVRSSQPISAAFAQEDVPPGQTRLPTMKAVDRFGENQIRPGAGQFATAVLPNGSGLPNANLVNAVVRRYGLDPADFNMTHDGVLSAEQALDFERILRRSESVAINDENDAGDQRFLVETDSRQTRGQQTLEDPRSRWRQDVVDAASSKTESVTEETPEQDLVPAESLVPGRDTHSGDSIHDQKASETTEGSELPELPDYILERGRAYEVPMAEKDFGKDVIFQVVQEGFNELLDPIFEKKERLAQRVRETRDERRRYRKEIDDHVREAKAFSEELATGAEVDPLLAMANAATPEGAVHDDEQDQQQAAGSSSNPGLMHVNTVDSDDSLPTPRELALELREHIAQQSETLDDNLEDMESNIRTQSLEDLLAQSGYMVEFADEPENQPMSAQYDGTSLDNAAHMPTTHTDEFAPPNLDDTDADGTTPDDAPISSNHSEGGQINQESESSLLMQTPFSTPNMNSSTFPTFRSNHTEQQVMLSKGKLAELARLDMEEKSILLRGGGGLLDFEEFEQIVVGDKRGLLRGLVESWLEWAEF